jgi:hypothetical protein
MTIFDSYKIDVYQLILKFKYWNTDKQFKK